MKILSLNGEWKFRENNCGDFLPATVPGCNFTDLMENGEIPDPFVGANEKDGRVQSVALKDWEYVRSFSVDDELLKAERAELVCESLDTLADVFINGERLFSADNMFKKYTADVKPFLRKGENDIRIVFYSPVGYARGEKEKYKLTSSFDAVAPAQYIRKAQYHFGWDWGPQLPPSGVAGGIYIRSGGGARIGEVSFSQKHGDGEVALGIDAGVIKDGFAGRLALNVEIITPAGETVLPDAVEVADGGARVSVNIKNPALWWPNGIFDRETQPLYRVNVYLRSGTAVLDTADYNIGLRTVELDTGEAEWGGRFAFKVNGRPIFAKGANWIPADSFRERVTYEKLDRLLKNMRDANMNMVRVWGGGFYESDDFYNICDKYGILVWQDCCFACMPYPLTNAEFVGGIEDEIYQNVGRVRHHASLALYCGNNEIEAMAVLWRFNKPLREATRKFFYETLPGWIRKKDGVTPYWAGSPSGGGFLKNVNGENAGDTHLWRVWHGLSPYTYYRKVYTNFCSEFGMQSLPSMNTVRKFADPGDFDLDSAVMKNHQKNAAGNSIMRYYLVSDFRSPKSFEDFVYLTQVIQAECMREPVEHWRRNLGRCNGALYWQFNDCWPVSSWAGVDYYGNFKALQYAAKRFNESLTLSIENGGTAVTLYVVNETAEDFKGAINWRVESFSGERLGGGEIEVESRENTSKKIADLDFSRLLKTRGADCVFVAELVGDGGAVTRKTALFRKPKKLNLPKSEISADAEASGGTARITLKSASFARYVKLEIEDVSEPFSDNFFDMTAGETRTVAVAVPSNWDAETVRQKLSVRSVADVEPGATEFSDFMYRVKTSLRPINVVKRIGYLLGL
ncbi:MAG: glycoside hydrolase family 2 protein [Clostridiales bacterium]|jgi:beta-mannosidase|nr:glycoside hydrolase family 2 protein [Clostridiales bacterium]